MNSLNLVDIGKRTASIRHELSPFDFASKLKISISTIGKIESGQSIPNGNFLLFLLGVSEEFKVDIMWLLTGQYATKSQSMLIHGRLSSTLNVCVGSAFGIEETKLAIDGAITTVITSVIAMSELNSKRQKPYAYLANLLNDFSDNELEQVIDYLEEQRLFILAAKKEEAKNNVETSASGSSLNFSFLDALKEKTNSNLDAIYSLMSSVNPSLVEKFDLTKRELARFQSMFLLSETLKPFFKQSLNNVDLAAIYRSFVEGAVQQNDSIKAINNKGVTCY